MQDFGDVVFELPDGDHEHMGAKHLRSVMGFNEMVGNLIAFIYNELRWIVILSGFIENFPKLFFEKNPFFDF